MGVTEESEFESLTTRQWNLLFYANVEEFLCAEFQKEKYVLCIYSNFSSHQIFSMNPDFSLILSLWIINIWWYPVDLNMLFMERINSFERFFFCFELIWGKNLFLGIDWINILWTFLLKRSRLGHLAKI